MAQKANKSLDAEITTIKAQSVWVSQISNIGTSRAVEFFHLFLTLYFAYVSYGSK